MTSPHDHHSRDHGHAFSTGHPARPETSEAGGHGHNHDHGLEGHATAGGKHRKKLILVLSITATVFLV